MHTDKNDSSYSHEYFNPPKTLVKSAVRVINVLEFFYRSREPARAADISKTLDYPVSSTKYLLTSLVESGYLTYDSQSRKYFPSIMFAGFASWLAEIYPSGEALRKLAQETYQKFGESVSITVQHEQYMRPLIIEMEGVEPPPSYDFRVRIPLIGSAGGLAVLAGMTEDEVAEIVRRELGKLPPQERKEKIDVLMADIKDTRNRGYAIKVHQIFHDGIKSYFSVIAMKILTTSGLPSMVLAVSLIDKNITGKAGGMAKVMRDLINRHHQELKIRF